ncbi:hypothetical protein IJO12_02180 [bacterium]|nr:hypothetical protein [bacterium]
MNISQLSFMNSKNNSQNYNLAKQQSAANINLESIKSNIAFGKGPDEVGRITKWLAKTYGKFMLNNKTFRKVAKWFAKKDPKDPTRHFQVIGSFVTSSAYMISTLKSKDIKKKNGRTLAINQALGFAIPTVAAYTVDSLLRGFNKSLEYSYSAANERKIALQKMSETQAAEALKRLNKGLRGFRTGLSILTFTMIYRLIAPVLITPVANKAGNWLNAKIDAKNAKNATTEQLNA